VAASPRLTASAAAEAHDRRLENGGACRVLGKREDVGEAGGCWGSGRMLGKRNSPPWPRRGGRDINKNIAKHPLKERTGWLVQPPIIGG
jgi:hypothetical protein